MMDTSPKNLCIRCGRERIVVKKWSERINTTMTQYTLALCPDKECQKIVDAQNALREEKRLLHIKKPIKSNWMSNTKQPVVKKVPTRKA